MAKYSVYGIMTASTFLGEYEAESKEEAVQMMEADDTVDFNPSLCHQCAHEIDLGDVHDTDVYEHEGDE